MKGKSLIKIISLLLILASTICVLSSSIGVSADEPGDIRQEIADLEKQSKDLEAQIKKKTAEKADNQAIVDAYQQKINVIQKQINSCESLISELNASIKASEDSIAQKNAEIAEKKEQFKKRIRALYTSNSESSLQLLLGAENFSDYLSLVELTQCVSAQDSKLVNDIATAVADIQKEIDANVSRKNEQNELKASMDEKKQQLKNEKAEFDKTVSQLNAEQKDLEWDNARIEKEIKNKENYLNTLLNGSSDYSGSFNGKFLWPVKGYTYHSAYFKGNDSVHKGNHNGIDISGGNIMGKPVRAAAAGVVESAYGGCPHTSSSKWHCSCGGNYGNNIVINHGKYNGTIYGTIYAHLKSISVSTNQTVTMGQTIGYVGSSGWSTGAHLHFGIKINNKQWVDPDRYSYIY